MPELVQRLQGALAGRYRVERELGSGGMATVCLAEDLKHSRRVAIKVLDPDVASAIGPGRFLHEIETAARLTHPHILPLFDSGSVDGLLYYVMPHVEGDTLRRKLTQEKQLPLEDALRLAREVAEALDYAHAHGVIHRDIKPENILLEEGHALVADFGIARAIEQGAAGTRSKTLDASPRTATGVMVGTPTYMSPEQAAGSQDIDGRSDVYSLGCVLYEMLAGQPPFTGPTAESLIHQHLSVPPRPVTELRAMVPAGVASAITKALAKTPADRYATGAAFTAALAGAGEAPAPSRHRVRATLLVAATALVALVSAAAWKHWWPFAGPSSPPPPTKKNSVLVADFDGPPGDSTLAPAVRSLVSAALDQSKAIATVPQEQIQAALKAAGKPRNARVDAELAKELAYRSSVRAVVEGKIGRLGKGYSLVLSVVDVDTTRTILTRSGMAKDEDALISAVGSLAKQLRNGLGENSQAIKATRSMGLVATPSFEAYRLYVQGRLVYLRRTSNQDALKFDRAALALDPDFATAWFDAGLKYANLGHPDSALTCFEEALRRPERLSLRQRLNAEQSRAFVLGDFRDAAAALDRMLDEDPEDWSALAGSNDVLCHLGRIEEALERTRRAMRLSPGGPREVERINEVGDLMWLGRFDEARASNRLQTSIWKAPERMWIELGAGRFAEAESIATATMKDPQITADLPDACHWELAAARFGSGAVIAADSKLKEVDEIYRRVRNPGDANWNRRCRIEFSVLSGGALPPPADAGGRDTSAAGLLTRGLRSVVAGDTALARRCLVAARARPSRELRTDSATPSVLEARLETIAGRPLEAVRLLRPIGVPALGLGVSLTWAHWWLADAFEQVARPDSAAYYLERACSIAFFHVDGVEKPYVHRRLALLYAGMGRVPDAERHLVAVERAWDRPDPEIRRMLEAARTAVARARTKARTTVKG